MGNSPWRYAANSVPGARSAPTPAISVSPAASADGSAQRLGGGSTGTACTLPNLPLTWDFGDSGPPLCATAA